MSANNTGGPAFPHVHFVDGRPVVILGVSVLDYFANGAMQGILAGSQIGFMSCEGVAAKSYEMARAMLAERNKQGEVK